MMISRILKQLSIHNSKRLELIDLDFACPFPQSIYSNHYLIFIIDSYPRFNWIFLLKHKSDAVALMKIWKAEVKLVTGDKIIGVRTDTAPELIQVFLSGNQKRDLK
jgi:hypothetical protein